MPELIAYFSRAGENYVNGNILNLSVGNTELAAKIIQEVTGADLYKIEPILEYSRDYSECLEKAKEEHQKRLKGGKYECPIPKGVKPRIISTKK